MGIGIDLVDELSVGGFAVGFKKHAGKFASGWEDIGATFGACLQFEGFYKLFSRNGLVDFA